MVVVYIIVNFIDLKLYVFTMYVESRYEGALFYDKILVINILLMYIS